MTQPDDSVTLTDSTPGQFTGPNGMTYYYYQDGTFTDQNGNAIPFDQGMSMLRDADLDE